MPTVREYFDRIKTLNLVWDDDNKLSDGTTVRSRQAIVYDPEGGTKHLRIYVPETEHPDAIVGGQLNCLANIWRFEQRYKVLALSGGFEESEDITAYPFVGRVNVYCESVIDSARWGAVAEHFRGQGLSLKIHDKIWADNTAKYEIPAAFLSHDSADKEDFVRPLAQKLAGMLVPVWYDEYSLKLGDSLRTSIQKGLKECGKCVVVLSKSFFANTGWTAKEFNAVYQREIMEGRNLMIPIWLGITKHDVYDYSPDLLDVFGIDASLGIDVVARKIAASLNWETAPTIGKDGMLVRPGEDAHLGSFDHDGNPIQA